MKIGCLQFGPRLGDVNHNLTRADRVLNKGNADGLDLLVLPEMAFSGYNYKSLRDIFPFLEPTGAGVSALWARTIALKLDCHVVVGYPETADVLHKWPTAPEYYNSAIVVNPDGETVTNYRKSHLYYTDETWALEGTKGFFAGHLPCLGRVAIGICMDLNPYRFQTPWENFEFAHHVLDSDANIVIVSMAWLTDEPAESFTSLPEEPDMNTLTYWAMRLEPIIRTEDGDEVIVVLCNRCGSEGEALYAGTSAVFGIQGGEVKVYGLLGRGSKDLLVVDTDSEPIAKLVLTAAGGALQSTATGRIEDKTRPPESVLRTSSANHRQDYDTLFEARYGSTSPDTTRDAKRLKQAPPRLQIPEQSSHAWRNAHSGPDGQGMTEVPTPEGPSPTPDSRRPNVDAALSSALATRMADSGVALSAREDSRLSLRPRNRSVTPGDEAVHLASSTPRGGDRRTPFRPQSRDSEARRSSRRRQQESLKPTVDTRRKDTHSKDGEGAGEESNPGRFQDSPVSRRPDASALSYWLETLPVGTTGRNSQPALGETSRDRESIKRSEASPPLHTCSHCGQADPAHGAYGAHGGEQEDTQADAYVGANVQARGWGRDQNIPKRPSEPSRDSPYRVQDRHTPRQEDTRHTVERNEYGRGDDIERRGRTTPESFKWQTPRPVPEQVEPVAVAVKVNIPNPKVQAIRNGTEEIVRSGSAAVDERLVGPAQSSLAALEPEKPESPSHPSSEAVDSLPLRPNVAESLAERPVMAGGRPRSLAW